MVTKLIIYEIKHYPFDLIFHVLNIIAFPLHMFLDWFPTGAANISAFHVID